LGSGATLEVDYLSLITDTGEVRTTEVSPGFSVRLLERGLTAKVDRFPDLLSSGRDADSRRVTISTEGTGDRNLLVSYISEVPVRKATYRLVPGAPQSFIQNLSQPYYSRRPVVDLPQSMNISPQTFEATLTTGSAQIAGRVQDSTGSPVLGTIVQAYDSNGGKVDEVRHPRSRGL
jgi:hypothetical protein